MIRIIREELSKFFEDEAVLRIALIVILIAVVGLSFFMADP